MLNFLILYNMMSIILGKYYIKQLITKKVIGQWFDCIRIPIKLISLFSEDMFIQKVKVNYPSTVDMCSAAGRGIK